MVPLENRRKIVKYLLTLKPFALGVRAFTFPPPWLWRPESLETLLSITENAPEAPPAADSEGDDDDEYDNSNTRDAAGKVTVKEETVTPFARAKRGARK